MTQKRLRQAKAGKLEIRHTLTQQEIEEDFDFILALNKAGPAGGRGGRASPGKRKRPAGQDGRREEAPSKTATAPQLAAKAEL